MSVYLRNKTYMRGENKSANFACEYDGFLDDMIFKEGVFLQ